MKLKRMLIAVVALGLVTACADPLGPRIPPDHGEHEPEPPGDGEAFLPPVVSFA